MLFGTFWSDGVYYPQTALVEIFGASRRIFDLLAEDERQLKQKQVAVSALPDQRLGLPDREGVLQEELALNLQTLLQTWREQTSSYHLTNVPPHVSCRAEALPSSMLTCMASFALFGTLSITSRPSLISPFPSSQQASSSCKHTQEGHKSRWTIYSNEVQEFMETHLTQRCQPLVQFSRKSITFHFQTLPARCPSCSQEQLSKWGIPLYSNPYRYLDTFQYRVLTRSP